jgi:two-component system, OmpR family, copper resistance phosphate regulon response regulator CusR
MHVLIVNYHSLRSQFIKKGLRYENIGADICHPENINRIWYGQYEIAIAPIKTWDNEIFKSIQSISRNLGKTPIIICTRETPPPSIKNQLEINDQIQFIGTSQPFKDLIQGIKTHKKIIKREEKIKIGDLYINIERHEVTRSNQILKLRHREFELLKCLMENAGKVLTRTYLLENVWDRNTSILSNTVDVHINRLRQKLNQGFPQKLITTIPRIGYKLSNIPNLSDKTKE